MGRRFQTVCNCFSVASKQAREAEIDLPSKKSFRLMHVSGNASSAPSMVAGTVLEGEIARTKIGLMAFLDCLNAAKNRVRQTQIDKPTRMSYRKLPE
jgi:hypothetical protein